MQNCSSSSPLTIKCEECGRTFARKCNMSAHRCTPFVASTDFTQLSPSSKKTFIYHRNLADGKFKCSRCKKHFGDTSNLNKHVKKCQLKSFEQEKGFSETIKSSLSTPPPSSASDIKTEIVSDQKQTAIRAGKVPCMTKTVINLSKENMFNEKENGNQMDQGLILMRSLIDANHKLTKAIGQLVEALIQKQ